ncbi:hypothetical protein D3C73_770000 [compost metagenome]
MQLLQNRILNNGCSNFIYRINVSIDDRKVLFVQLHIGIGDMSLQNFLCLVIAVAVQDQYGRNHNQKQQNQLLLDVQPDDWLDKGRQHLDTPPVSIIYQTDKRLHRFILMEMMFIYMYFFG